MRSGRNVSAASNLKANCQALGRNFVQSCLTLAGGVHVRNSCLFYEFRFAQLNLSKAFPEIPLVVIRAFEEYLRRFVTCKARVC